MRADTFYDKVYDIVRQIPAGRVCSYGAIASYLGAGGTSRMVGYAMKTSSEIYPPVPAHRVVNRNGLLTAKHAFITPTLMQELLESEGIEIIDDKIKHFRRVFWNPAEEL